MAATPTPSPEPPQTDQPQSPPTRPTRSLRWRVSRLLDGLDTPASRWINLAIALSTLLSSLTFALETFPSIAPWRPVLNLANRSLAGLFAIEYLLRLWCAKRPWRFIFSVYSFIDLVAIAPLLVGLWDVGYLRLLRWFRILRLIRFLDRKYIPGKIAGDDAIVFARILFTIFSLLFIYAGLIYQVEHGVNPEVFDTFLAAFYFAVATITTVGFGDITPSTDVGRLVTVLMILSGVVLVPWQVGDLVRYIAQDAATTARDDLKESLRQRIRQAAKEIIDRSAAQATVAKQTRTPDSSIPDSSINDTVSESTLGSQAELEAELVTELGLAEDGAETELARSQSIDSRPLVAKPSSSPKPGTVAKTGPAIDQAFNQTIDPSIDQTIEPKPRFITDLKSVKTEQSQTQSQPQSQAQGLGKKEVILFLCDRCGLDRHDADARYCKRCGDRLIPQKKP